MKKSARYHPGRAIVLALLACAVLGTVAAAAPPDPTEAAREVFQDPEFWWKRTEKVEVELPWYQKIFQALWDLFVEILKRVWEWLVWLFSKLFSFASGDWSAGTPLVWLAACVCIAWALWKLYPVLRQWLRGDGASAAAQQPLPFHELPQAELLFAQASEACRAGRYAEAIRLTLLAFIARLQQDGLLRYDPTRTNREYQIDLRPRPDLAALFGDIARPFERVWYGQQSATPGEAERVLEWCRPIVSGGGVSSA